MKVHKNKPGPKRLDYIPVPFRGIEGIEQLTTVRQFENLKVYMETPEYERLPCVRIGASVPQYSEEAAKVSSATYAVTIDGVVSVVKAEIDPRQAHKWFNCPRRPWNLSARFATTGGA